MNIHINMVRGHNTDEIRSRLKVASNPKIQLEKDKICRSENSDATQLPSSPIIRDLSLKDIKEK